MKKVSLIIVTILMLSISIVFCGCNDGYKDLKIQTKTKQISLVLDDEDLAISNKILFTLSGAKSWGEISIESEPMGLVQSTHKIDGKECWVQVKALQPSMDGSSLVIKHLGSGKSIKVPLKIGMKLKTIESAGKDFIIELPKFENEEDIKQIEIPSNQLLNCFPSNYTDIIVWQNELTLPAGVKIVSYNTDGEEVPAFTLTTEKDGKRLGVSDAVKTVIKIDKDCKVSNFVVNPISILEKKSEIDNNATLYNNIKVNIKIAELLKKEDVEVTSATHGDDEGLLKDLVLLNNPDPNAPEPRLVDLNGDGIIDDSEENTGYDYYSTAIIDLKKQGSAEDIMQFSSLYDMELSTNLEGLRLENVKFGKIRAIATSSCVGVGKITISFVPKSCVGDIRSFSFNIDCTVAERATSFRGTNDGNSINILKNDEYSFSCIEPLRDSLSHGQAFRFEMLSTNTVDALKNYKITIDKHLLYINPNDIITDDPENLISNHIWQKDKSKKVVLNDILAQKYEYQISILNGSGGSMEFVQEGTDFVSDTIKGGDTIYIKWVKSEGGKPLGEKYFGIKLSNFYDDRYNIKDDGFDGTKLTLNLAFDRQRTIESIEYVPIEVSKSRPTVPQDIDENWQFYFEPSMFDNDEVYYGFWIRNIVGINNTELTDEELKNINLTISMEEVDLGQDSSINIGFAQFNLQGIYTFSNNYDNFQFDKVSSNNIILIGKIDTNKDVDYADYMINIKQDGTRLIATRNVKVYKILEDDDISVKIASAEFGGDYLKYERVEQSTIEPDDWNKQGEGIVYYEYIGGSYLPVSSGSTWQPNKAYYKRIDGGIVDFDSTYILATSKTYDVQIEVLNKNYLSLSGQEAQAEMVANSTPLDNSYATNIIGRSAQGKVITTGLVGSFNTSTKEKNYVKLTYTITANTYSYYKVNTTETESASKIVYLYIYEPLTWAKFDKTMVYKYDIDSIKYPQFKMQYGTETLNIELNNESVSNYVNIEWKMEDDGITGCEIEDSTLSATYTFGGLPEKEGVALDSNLMATISQFGIQYPIYCGFVLRKPILSEKVILNNSTQSFASGGAYINLKVGDQLQIDASAISSKGEVSMPGFGYVVCSATGYETDIVASVNGNGLLTANKAGRVKLLVVAKDGLTKSLNNVTNYFEYTKYMFTNAHVVIDIIVSDGSKENPFLIADVNDFKNIANDYYIDDGSGIKVNANGDTTKINDYYYALISNIDLKGIEINFENFNGVITSFQENEDLTEINRFNIYGIMLTENNPNIFKNITLKDAYTANFENINLHIDINYKSTEKQTEDILIGFIGTNNGLVKNVTVEVSGSINANSKDNEYIVGAICAVNNGSVIIDNKTVVGVEGEIVVNNANTSTITIGGVIGKNTGKLEGAHTEPTLEEGGAGVEYDVYYDSQGATADIVLKVKGAKNGSAVGGVIGLNQGTVINVYSTGKILGKDDANNLAVNNVGGLIGKNEGSNIISSEITKNDASGYQNLAEVKYTSDNFQIVNCYSSAQVAGHTNVGGAVGYDSRGSYKKVYYEIYSSINAIEGHTNVGGLIGYTEDSNLYYCYANSFAWNYASTVEIYDITGNTNVGGLIGFAKSSKTGGFEITNPNLNNKHFAMNVVASASSVTIDATSSVGGIIGKLKGFGAIYTAYYYGLSTSSDITPIAKISGISNIPYNNVYAIVNNEDKLSADLYGGNGFETNPEYNNGKPYILYNGISLITIVPTTIQIDQALSEDYYNDKTNHKIYRRSELGDYVLLIDESMEVYNPEDKDHAGRPRYTLIASLIDTGDESDDKSNYRQKALILYYYQFKDMSGEHALEDLYSINTIDMHSILKDDKIVVLPNTYKRFNLRSSDNSIVSILQGGKLLLRKEGQATITLISTLNSGATASFVVYVRSKVLEFGLYSSANIRDEYNIKGDTISIVKNSSKIIYADYSSVVSVAYNREYEYSQATNMEIDFKITSSVSLPEGKTIADYIVLNGTYNDVTETYTIPHGTPITITVKEHFEGVFTITATPYIVVKYNENKIRKELSSYFNTSFSVVTKMGASAVNVNKNLINMMPVDDNSNLDVKITTDVKLTKLYYEIIALGTIKEFINIANPTGDTLKCVDMLDINALYAEGLLTTSADDVGKYFDISGVDLADLTQEFDLTLKLNNKAYYTDQPFRLQIRLFVLNGERQIEAIMHIDVKPQEITSLIPLNYRMNEGVDELSIDNANLSQIIRPGSSNIITIDIAPSIAIYDYVEIVDTTTQDQILFQQVDENFDPLDNMDTWVDNGIKLKKYDATTSRLYLIARLPLNVSSNITHTLQIRAYSKDGKVLKEEYLNIEAVMYPTIVMSYIPPKGDILTVNTQVDGGVRHEAIKTTNLALGVEAELNVATYNIDAESLQYNITIKDDRDNIIPNANYVYLNYQYGKYYLQFNNASKHNWGDLLGKTIVVTFTASKELNGIVERCSASIEFTIRRMVIHAVSIDRTNSKGEIYGDWGENFDFQFYFDRTDISYYNNGYWNIQYTLSNTTTDIENEDIYSIHNILERINKWNSSVVELYYMDKNRKLPSSEDIKLDSDRVIDGVTISNNEDKHKFTVNASSESNINSKKLYITMDLHYSRDGRPILREGGLEVASQFNFYLTDKSSRFEEFLTVSNQQEFEDMQIGKYYRLINDIELRDYTPLDTAIGALDGDGYTITIKSFNESQLIQNYISSAMHIGLFSTLAEEALIQNLVVYYNLDSHSGDSILNFETSVSMQEKRTNNIYFGGIAAINLGIITNVKVIGRFKLIASYISPDKISIGGITAENGSTESQYKIATITGAESSISISAMASIGGISVVNNGKITNSLFNGKIESKDTAQYASSIFTAGFVVNNTNRGYISLSYVNCGLVDNGYNIHTVGAIGGFVFNNNGEINNCYINQTSIKSQGNIGGFVYKSSGKIDACYSYASLGSSWFYEEFIHSTEDVGTISNCYVITDSDRNLNVQGLLKIKVADVQEQSLYKGFVFSNTSNGIWTITDKGPHLANAGFDDNRREYYNIYNISDIETFETYFKTEGSNIEGKVFRIVRDIDFSTFDGNPITSTKTLRANLEGNDMTLINYNINNQSNIESVGLFSVISTLNTGTYVRNLILRPESIKASQSMAVGALAGTIDGANIYNIDIDASNILILGKNAVGGLAGVIKGFFDIQGITSNASGLVSYSNNVGKQYNLYKGKNVTGSPAIDNLHEVSYIGSIAGIVDGYDASRYTAINRDVEEFYTISNLIVYGDIKLIGETVGGAFGLVGERTQVKNITYNLSSNSIYQAVYISGGLVGENRGIIQDANIYAYDTSNNTKANTSACFDGFARVNGGIVGVNIGGLVYNSSSDIDICSNVDIATVGGIVGRNIEGCIYNCEVSSTLQGYFVGGLVGTDYSYEEITKTSTQGEGSATDKTVYDKTIKPSGTSRVNYLSVESEAKENHKFYKNVITHKFIDKFMKVKNQYYTFKIESSGFTHDTRAVYGLAVGLTSNSYIIEDKTEDIKYNSGGIDGLLLTLGTCSKENAEADYGGRAERELKYMDKDYTVKPIKCFLNAKLNSGANYPSGTTKTMLWYIIAYDNANYEFWSSSLKYTNQYILIFEDLKEYNEIVRIVS